MTSTSMDGEDAIVLCIVDKESGVCGFTWLVQPHRTSFYVKSTYTPLQMTKVSIHGPDPNHIDKQHFRIDFTRAGEAQRALNAGGGWVANGKGLPLYFTGRPVNKRTVHIVRFSAEWNMFRPGMQRGPDPKANQKASLNAFADAPAEGFVTHIDLYLSRVRPFWRNDELKIRRNNAGIGPLVNDAGMYLTAIISQWRETKEPDPFGDVSDGLPGDQLIRGVAEGVDDTGLLWVCEKMMPKSNLSATAPPS